MESVEIFSLKEHSKTRIKNILNSIKDKNPNAGAFLLVLDQQTTKIISSFFNMTDLLDAGITAIEKLELTRKPFPKMHAIYFITPGLEQIQLLQKDFKYQINSIVIHNFYSKNVQYGYAHILFSNKVPNDLMSRIANDSQLMSRIKGFKEVNQDFLCKDENIFDLNIQNALQVLYSMKGSKQEYETGLLIADKLFTIIPSLGSYFEFEIAYNSNPNEISQFISESLIKKVNKHIQSLKEKPNDILDQNAGKVTFVILDRSIDVVSPIIHDFYYQSLILDLLDVNNDVIKYQDQINGKIAIKQHQFNKKDQVFHSYKYKHIAEVLDGIPAEFQAFVQSSSTAQFQKGAQSGLSLDKMQDIVKSMPQYNEKMAVYQAHMKIIDNLWKIFEEHELKDLGEIEQSLATGLDSDGKATNELKLIKAIGKYLDPYLLGQRINSNKSTPEEKLRLVLIALITLNLAEKDRLALTDHIDFIDQKLLTNLSWFGINVQNDGKKKPTKKIDPLVQKLAKAKMNNQTIDLCRHTPSVECYIQTVIQNITVNSEITKNLNIELKTTKLNQNAKSDLNTKSLKKKGVLGKVMGIENEGDQKKQIPKLIVFIVGGISAPEIRALKSLQTKDMQVIVGGTSILTPQNFLKDLGSMKSTVDL